jgi:hypothetical protein
MEQSICFSASSSFVLRVLASSLLKLDLVTAKSNTHNVEKLLFRFLETKGR